MQADGHSTTSYGKVKEREVSAEPLFYSNLRI